MAMKALGTFLSLLRHFQFFLATRVPWVLASHLTNQRLPKRTTPRLAKRHRRTARPRLRARPRAKSRTAATLRSRT
ncbi:uncharacterized protein BKA78DRAFT_321425 [Phyllosticta capitalensis]|uniref:uncharacterized protein n=1 Tax=Phyllosticta capitalensis TaxID=121624 RepID=UPI003131F0E5